MDILAHGLWTNAVFYKKFAKDKKNRWLGVMFGILPDIVSFAPVTVYLLLNKLNFSPALYASDIWVFRYAGESYKYTHSLVVFVLVMIIVMVIRKGRVWWPMLGWAIHILIDIPTHKGFYETPFLHPLSDYTFSSGLSWAVPAFMVINYGGLAIVYFTWLLKYRRQ